MYWHKTFSHRLLLLLNGNRLGWLYRIAWFFGSNASQIKCTISHGLFVPINIAGNISHALYIQTREQNVRKMRVRTSPWLALWIDRVRTEAHLSQTQNTLEFSRTRTQMERWLFLSPEISSLPTSCAPFGCLLLLLLLLLCNFGPLRVCNELMCM